MSKRKKILIPWYRFPPFSDSSTGGLSVALWELSQNLAHFGFDVECVAPPDGDSPNEEKIQDVLVHRGGLGDKLIHGKRLDAADKRFLEVYDCIVSIENFGASSFFELKHDLRILRQIHTVAKDRPVSSFLSLSSSFSEHLRMVWIKRKLEGSERRLRGVTSICVSRFLAARMEELGIESKQNIAIAPNGVNLELFRPARMTIERDLIYIGRFQRAKGLDLLLKALDLLLRQGEIHDLGIVGNFSEKEQAFCRAMASDDLKKHINFMGHYPHEKIPEVLNSSRLLVAPSRYESFCLPVLEAQACGIPVVASNQGGIPELVEEGTGFLVKPDDVHSLAQGISKAMSDDNLSRNSKILGPQRAHSYDWNSLACVWEGLLSNQS